MMYLDLQLNQLTFAAKPVNFEVLKVGSGGRINDVSAFAAKPVNFAAKPVNFGKPKWDLVEESVNIQQNLNLNQ